MRDPIGRFQAAGWGIFCYGDEKISVHFLSNKLKVLFIGHIKCYRNVTT